MKIHDIPLHNDWIETIADVLVQEGISVAFVSSYNELRFLQKALGERQCICRLFVLPQLDKEQVVAEFGWNVALKPVFQGMDYQQQNAFLFDCVRGFFAEQDLCVPVSDIVGYIKDFLFVYEGADCVPFMQDLGGGYGEKSLLYKDLFVLLEQALLHHKKLCVRRQQEILRAWIQKCTHKTCLVAINQPINDNMAAFVRSFMCQEKVRVFSYGGCFQGEDICDTTSTNYSQHVEEYACAYMHQEIEQVVDHVMRTSGECIIASADLYYMRALMSYMDACGVEYWNGLGTFFWDTDDGRWIFACVQFLSQPFSVVALHTVLSFLWERDVLESFDKQWLRKGDVPLSHIIKAMPDDGYKATLSFVYNAWLSFQKNCVMACVQTLVAQRAFIYQFVQEAWSNVLDAAFFNDIPVTIQGLKALLNVSLLHKRQRERVLCVHINDVRLFNQGTVFVCGLVQKEDRRLEGIALPSHCPLMEYLCSRGPLMRDFQGCLTFARVLLFWHKHDGLEEKRPSFLLEYAREYVHCQRYIIEAPSGSVVVAQPQEGVRVSKKHIPYPRTVSDVMLLLDKPYDFYLRHVLQLCPMPYLGETKEALRKGVLIHRVMEKKDLSLGEKMRYAAHIYTKKLNGSLASLEWCELAASIVALSRYVGQGDDVWVEKAGVLRLCLDGNEQSISLRVDRLDKVDMWRIIDFKTGSWTSLQKLCQDVSVGWQLVCEGLAVLQNNMGIGAPLTQVRLCLLHVQRGVMRVKERSLGVQEAQELKRCLEYKINAFYHDDFCSFSTTPGRESFYPKWLMPLC